MKVGIIHPCFNLIYPWIYDIFPCKVALETSSYKQYYSNNFPVYFHEDTIGAIKTKSFQESINQLADSDVLMIWGISQNIDLSFFKGPVILSSHGSDRWTRNQIRNNQHLATHFLAVSQSSARCFPPDKDVKIIPNGIKPVQITETIKIDGNKPKIISLKHHEIKSSRYQQIHLNNYHKNFYNILNVADIIVNLSPSEGDNKSIKEAMLLGKPIVSTITGSIPEMESIHGQMVVAVPFDTTNNEIDDAIQFGLSNNFKKIIRKNQKIMQQYFNIEDVKRKYKNYLEEVYVNYGGCRVSRKCFI